MSKQANMLSLATRYLQADREVTAVIQQESTVYFIDVDPLTNSTPLSWSVSPNGHIEEKESVNGEWVQKPGASYHLMGFANRFPAALPPIRRACE